MNKPTHQYIDNAHYFEVNLQLLVLTCELNKQQFRFDKLISEFSPFNKKLFIRKILIDGLECFFLNSGLNLSKLELLYLITGNEKSGNEDKEKIANNFLSCLNKNEKIIANHIEEIYLDTIIDLFLSNGNSSSYYKLLTKLYGETKSYVSILFIEVAFKNKNELDELAKKEKCLNCYMTTFLYKLIKKIETSNAFVAECLNEIESIKNQKFTLISKTEEAIIKALIEANLFCDYGLTIDEIIECTKISKRSIIYTFNKLKENRRLTKTQIGRNIYNKTNIY